MKCLPGTLEGLGSAGVIDIVEDVPEWLDEIVIRCLRKVREDRYQSIKDIFTDLKTLSKGKKDPDEILAYMHIFMSQHLSDRIFTCPVIYFSHDQ